MIATTIEQSMHLLELGLDTKSADMVWVRYAAGGYRLEVLHRELFERIMETDIASWSLPALLTSCGMSEDKETMQQFSTENFCEVEYKGHSYIMFMYSVGYAGYAGLTHNPDCPCKKEGNDGRD